MFQKMRLFRIFSVYFHAVPVCPCHCPHGHPAAEAPTPGPASALVPGPAPCRLPDEPCRSHRAGQGRGIPGAMQIPREHMSLLGTRGTLKDVPPCGRLALPSHGSRAAFVERGGEEFGGAII